MKKIGLLYILVGLVSLSIKSYLLNIYIYLDRLSPNAPKVNISDFLDQGTTRYSLRFDYLIISIGIYLLLSNRISKLVKPLFKKSVGD